MANPRFRDTKKAKKKVVVRNTLKDYSYLSSPTSVKSGGGVGNPSSSKYAYRTKDNLNLFQNASPALKEREFRSSYSKDFFVNSESGSRPNNFNQTFTSSPMYEKSAH